MEVTARRTVTTTPDDRLLLAADQWGSDLATRLADGATLWVWGDPDHHDLARDLVDGLVERGAIGRVRHLRLEAPLSAARTIAVRRHDLVLLCAGAEVPRSALLSLRRSGAAIWALTDGKADWVDYVDDRLVVPDDAVRRAVSRIILAYARTTRERFPQNPPLPFAASYPRQVIA